ncbi:uncharacterized protein LOC119338786 isoform X3 [Triticum dicoccoides]|uniref:uncharacterized protein LOC119338786 isoform X3 n=1 Tax=Triticum dicoccoides TaxID=85692 RepID=UPI0018919E8D|nr:uncharacterized protein LOC119338786 isoform X3 [Triticum dicoccoides]
MESVSERTGAMDSPEPRIETIPRKDEKTVKPTISLDSSVINLPSEGQVQAVTSNIGGEHRAAYPQHIYSSQAQPFYYQGTGYENLPNECDVYPPYTSVDGLEVGPALWRPLSRPLERDAISAFIVDLPSMAVRLSPPPPPPPPEPD